ncbi:MAG: hypothetical protein ACKVQJ_13765 [Pyrinomonadaceae bacterium]
MKAVLKSTYQAVVMVIFMTFCGGLLLAQDGSDMNYTKPQDLDKSHIGRRMHIDFYRRSFGNRQGGGLDVDRVSLEIGGKQIEFVEHREDDGLNNWFFEQYLESADKKARIREFKLLGIEKETITVIGYFNIEPFEKEFTFSKSEIAVVLMKVIDSK